MKLKFYVLFLFTVVLSLDLHAQCTDVTLSSQADVDSYPSVYGCSIVGNLQITGRNITNLDSLYQITSATNLDINSALDLTDVSGLSSLQTVTGQFSIINNVSLTSLHGLEALTSVGNFDIHLQRDMDLTGLSGLTTINGDFILLSNAISSLHGLGNLEEITGQLMMRNDSGLVSLGGLSGLKHLGSAWIFQNYTLETMGMTSLQSIGKVLIYENEQLANFDGLSSLTSIGDLDVFENPRLSNVSGLSSVTTFNGGLRFSANPMLSSLAGLENVHTVSVSLRIYDNDALTSLGGLAITTVNGSVYIAENANLESLHGLEGLTTVRGGCDCPFSGLLISGHPKLSNIGLTSLTSIGGALIIRNNPLIKDLDALVSLTSVGVNTDFGDQGIEISGNASLTNMEGLRNIAGDLRGGLEIYNNDALTTLEGLENITDVGNSLYVRGNASLVNIDALSKVRSASYDVTISDNPVLENLNGLASLSNIDGKTNSSLTISNNPMITNVDSLSSLISMSTPTRNLVVTNNPNLTKGCGLYTVIQNSFTCTACAPLTTMSGNGPGFTEQEIRAGGPCEDTQTSTCSGNVNLSSQAEVDSFPSTYGCSVITGSLNIKGADITNLDSLYQVTTVKGLCDCPLRGLVIDSNPNLLNVNGLSSLVTIDAEAMVWVVNNQALTDVDGLSGITSIGRNSVYGDYSINIDNNPSLVTLAGLNSITDVPGNVIVSNNAALTDLDGLQKLTSTGGGLTIVGNQSLVSINGLSSLGKTLGVRIENNAALQNLDGLGSLVHVWGSPGASFKLNNNPSLTNVDSLSSLIDLAGPARSLMVTNNTSLTRGCGFYNLLSTNFCDGCPGDVTFSGNGAGVTKDEILAAGPCEGDDDSGVPTAPADLVFADVTDNSMTVSYTAGERADGYITIMRAFESALPDEAPQDATEYSVGNVIGCCSIVVGKGTDASLYIIYQEPDIDYYFDVIPYTLVNNMYNYFPEVALSGSQRTLPRAEPYPNPFVEGVTIPFTVGEEGTSVRIMISDQLGRPISEVANDRFDRGKHRVTWNRIDMASNRAGDGIYMYSISVEGNNPVKGLVVAK